MKLKKKLIEKKSKKKTKSKALFQWVMLCDESFVMRGTVKILPLLVYN